MSTNDIALPSHSTGSPPSPDFEKYRPLLGDAAFTDEQANALLLEVWLFMARCVEAQFTLPTIPDIFAVLLHENAESASDDVESSSEIRREALTCAGSEHGDE